MWLNLYAVCWSFPTLADIDQLCKAKRFPLFTSSLKPALLHLCPTFLISVPLSLCFLVYFLFFTSSIHYFPLPCLWWFFVYLLAVSLFLALIQTDTVCYSRFPSLSLRPTQLAFRICNSSVQQVIGRSEEACPNMSQKLSGEGCRWSRWYREQGFKRNVGDEKFKY